MIDRELTEPELELLQAARALGHVRKLTGLLLDLKKKGFGAPQDSFTVTANQNNKRWSIEVTLHGFVEV